MTSKEMETAVYYHIVDRVQKLETALRAVNHVTKAEFDLAGLSDSLPMVILVKHDIEIGGKFPSGSPEKRVSKYFGMRKTLIDGIMAAAKENGLTLAGDRIEDYGEYLYFVFTYDAGWKAQIEKGEKQTRLAERCKKEQEAMNALFRQIRETEKEKERLMKDLSISEAMAKEGVAVRTTAKLKAKIEAADIRIKEARDHVREITARLQGTEQKMGA